MMWYSGFFRINSSCIMQNFLHNIFSNDKVSITWICHNHTLLSFYCYKLMCFQLFIIISRIDIGIFIEKTVLLLGLFS